MPLRRYPRSFDDSCWHQHIEWACDASFQKAMEFDTLLTVPKRPCQSCRRCRVRLHRTLREEIGMKGNIFDIWYWIWKALEPGSSRSCKSFDECHHESTHLSKEPVTVIELVHAFYRRALECWSYCLADRSQHYYDDMASRSAKMVRCLKVQRKSQMFGGPDLISILRFLKAIQIVCDTNGIL